MKRTGVYATKQQLEEVTNSYQLDFCTPIMATLPGGKVPRAKEDFRYMANRFALEAGLNKGNYAIDPETREFVGIEE